MREIKYPLPPGGSKKDALAAGKANIHKIGRSWYASDADYAATKKQVEDFYTEKHSAVVPEPVAEPVTEVEPEPIVETVLRKKSKKR